MTAPGNDTEVGGIVAYLRVNDSDWKRVLDEAERRARALGQTNPTIRVQVADHAAMARIAALETQLSVLQHQLNQVGGQGSQSQGASGARHQVSLLATALMALGPAAIPLAGVATGAMAGLVGSAGTAALAILGIKDAMEQGTKVGQEYKQAFAPIVTEFQRLKDIAAAGVFGGINRAIQDVKPSFGQVEMLTHDLAGQLGNIAGNVGRGLVGLFTALAPLFRTLGDALQRMTGHFADWATSSGAMKGFVSYVQSELPHVEQLLSNLMAAVSNVTKAFAPYGSLVLDTLSGLSSVIAALPVPVVQALGAAFLTLRLSRIASESRLVQVAFVGLRAAILRTGASMRVASVASGGLMVALAAAGLVYLAFTGHSQAAARAQQEMKSETEALTQAIEEDSGALGENTREHVRSYLQQQGGVDIARKLGVNLATLTDAAMGNSKAYASVSASVYDAVTAHRLSLDQGVKLLGLLKGETTSVRDSTQAYKDKRKEIQQAAAAHGQQVSFLDDVTRKTGLAADTTKNYAAMVGLAASKDGTFKASLTDVESAVLTVSDAYTVATETGSKFLDALKQFSGSAGTAADRAALIGATLKAANGDALNYADVMNGAAVANKNLIDGLKNAAKQIGKNGISVGSLVDRFVNLKKGTIDYTKAAAAPLISGLSQMQSAAMKAASATYQHYLATMDQKSAADKAYRVYVGQTRGALIDEADKLGITKGQAKKLADEYFGMPKKVKTLIEQEGAGSVKSILGDIRTVLVDIAKAWGINVDVNVHATAALQQLESINNEIATMTAHAHKSGKTSASYLAVSAALGHAKHNLSAFGNAAGGTIVGPGTGTSDSVLRWLSNGEEVIRASEAAKWRPLLKAINNGNGAKAIQAMQRPQEQRPIVQNFYPQQPMDANAVGAASARWYAAAVR